MPNRSIAQATVRLDEEGFACCCAASELPEGGWIATVRFEKVAATGTGLLPALAPPSKVPGVFLDSDDALSAAASYAVRTVQWRRV